MNSLSLIIAVSGLLNLMFSIYSNSYYNKVNIVIYQENWRMNNLMKRARGKINETFKSMFQENCASAWSALQTNECQKLNLEKILFLKCN